MIVSMVFCGPAVPKRNVNMPQKFSLLIAAGEFNFDPNAAVDMDASYGVDSSGCFFHARLEKRLALATCEADAKTDNTTPRDRGVFIKK